MKQQRRSSKKIVRKFKSENYNIFKALETGIVWSPSVLIRATVACLVNLDLLSILQ